MLKILLKAAVLLFIVFSIYFIVNPTACSNMMSGRTSAPSDAAPQTPAQEGTEQTDTLSPAQQSAPQGAVTEDGTYVPYDTQGIFDTNTMKEETAQPVYSQQDIDYAVASRYVELEREYARNRAVGKDTAREISYIVMEDFEMSPAEWEGFLSRATATDLFNKVRQEMPPAPEEAAAQPAAAK